MAEHHSTPKIIDFPTELAGIAEQFERLRDFPELRAALAGAIYQAVGTFLTLHKHFAAEKKLPPLTREQQAVIDYLRENGVTPAEELAAKIGYSANTIKTWCGPGGVLREHGVKPTTRGYSSNRLRADS